MTLNSQLSIQFYFNIAWFTSTRDAIDNADFFFEAAVVTNVNVMVEIDL